MFKDFDEIQAFSKGNAEAMITSATAWTKGMQSVAAEMTETSRVAFENSKDSAEKVISAGSVEKSLEIQTKFVSESMDAYVGAISRAGELYMEAAMSAFKPLEARAVKAGKKANVKASA